MRQTRRPQRPTDDPGSFGAFDAIVGGALALIVAGIIVAGRAGTAIAALRAHARAAGAPTGFGGLLGLAIFALVVAGVVVAGALIVVARRRYRHRTDETAPTT
jgi:hypothetical protein